MKELTEEIHRIKKLMLVENDDQLSLFTGKGTPINLNSTEFTKKFKEKVYFILKDLYKSNWDSDRSRGPGGGGGVDAGVPVDRRGAAARLGRRAGAAVVADGHARGAGPGAQRQRE